MSTLPDTRPSDVTLEEAEEASAHLGEQVERARRILAHYRNALGCGQPPEEGDGTLAAS